jgi:hypothetical protein
MRAVMNSNNILSLACVFLLGIIIITTLGIGQTMKAGLVNDDSYWFCWPE